MICWTFASRSPHARSAARSWARLNHTVTVNYQNWNIDLALGPPPGAPQPPSADERITFAVPAVVEVAIEAKGVMTEHGKARHNRLRDLQAFHHHAHIYNQKVIAVGVIVVNIAEFYWSPTRPASDITRHRNIEQIAAETVNLYRNLPLRNSPSDGPGLEAACVLVVRHDNLGKNVDLPSGSAGQSRDGADYETAGTTGRRSAELRHDGAAGVYGVHREMGVDFGPLLVSLRMRDGSRSSREPDQRGEVVPFTSARALRRLETRRQASMGEARPRRCVT